MKESEPLIKRNSHSNFAENNESSSTLNEPTFNPTATSGKISESNSKESKDTNKNLPIMEMEEAFNTDFSDVKIHKNSYESSLLGAKAFTQNNEIHFSPGQFNPDTTQGMELIGHEFAHVIQQRSSSIEPTGEKKGKKINNSFSLEAQANDAGKAVGKGQKPRYIPPKNNTIQTNQPIQAFGLGEAKDWLGEKASQTWELGKSGIGTVQSGLSGAIHKTKDWGVDKAGEIKDNVVGMAGGAMDAVPAITSFIKLAGQAIHDILQDPVGFLKNIFDAVKKGFGNFFGNITQHLLNGLIDWIFNAANQAGIKFPASFNIEGIMSLVLQILGTVWSAIKKKILDNISKIIDKVGENARFIVEKVIELGPTAIIEALRRYSSKSISTYNDTAKGVIENIKS